MRTRVPVQQLASLTPRGFSILYPSCEQLQVPGQFVGVRLISDDLAHGSDTSEGRAADRLLSIASSPYAARRDSSNLDATIIEVKSHAIAQEATFIEIHGCHIPPPPIRGSA